jgi:cytidylate kinase
MEAASDRVVEALARLHRVAETHPAPAPPGAPPAVAVALTRQAGSRGAEVARAAGARLGWPVYDNELLKRIAEEKGLPEKLLATLDERHFSWLEGAMRSFSPAAGATERAYVKGLLEVLAALGEAGHCVIVGRGAAHVLPAETTLRVRVVAPRESRLAAVQASMDFTPEQAARWVDHTDHERALFVQRAFRADVADPLGYDLVLNSARLGIDGCADLIAQAARGQDERARQGAR